jgi:hypothetical protein
MTLELMLYIGFLFSLAMGLYVYVAWRIRCKRLAMKCITINERESLMKASLTATIFLSTTFITLTVIVINTL